MILRALWRPLEAAPPVGTRRSEPCSVKRMVHWGAVTAQVRAWRAEEALGAQPRTAHSSALQGTHCLTRPRGQRSPAFLASLQHIRHMAPPGFALAVPSIWGTPQQREPIHLCSLGTNMPLQRGLPGPWALVLPAQSAPASTWQALHATWLHPPLGPPPPSCEAETPSIPLAVWQGAGAFPVDEVISFHYPNRGAFIWYLWWATLLFGAGAPSHPGASLPPWPVPWPGPLPASHKAGG